MLQRDAIVGHAEAIRTQSRKPSKAHTHKKVNVAAFISFSNSVACRENRSHVLVKWPVLMASHLVTSITCTCMRANVSSYLGPTKMLGDKRGFCPCPDLELFVVLHGVLILLMCAGFGWVQCGASGYKRALWQLGMLLVCDIVRKLCGAEGACLCWSRWLRVVFGCLFSAVSFQSHSMYAYIFCSCCSITTMVPVCHQQSTRTIVP